MRRRKPLIAFLAIMIVAITAFDSYAWWTRRSGPSFSQGGAFGAAPSPAESAPSSRKARPAAAGARPTASAEPTRTRSAEPRTNPTRVPSSGDRTHDRLRAPASGRYVYDAEGREDVDFGSASACGWDVERVVQDVKRSGDDIVMDTTVSDEHQQRGIYSYREDGMYQRYFGAAVTCVGVRRAEESDYDPPTIRMAAPFDVGRSWKTVSRTRDWTETTRGRILRRETIQVPAGRFTAYVVSLEAEFTDGQSGHFKATMWFSPTLGIWVKEKVDTVVRSSGATFTSAYTIELAAHP